MTEKLNAGAEMEKELAEKLGWWKPTTLRDEYWHDPKGCIVPPSVVAALLEYAAEAALYCTQWKDTETLLRAVEQQRDTEAERARVLELELGDLQDLEEQWRDLAASAYQVCGALNAPARILDYFSAIADATGKPPSPLPITGEEIAESAESRVAALQAQLETLKLLFERVEGQMWEDNYKPASWDEFRAALSQLPTPAQDL